MRAFKEYFKFLCDDTRQSKGSSTVRCSLAASQYLIPFLSTLWVSYLANLRFPNRSRQCLSTSTSSLKLFSPHTLSSLNLLAVRGDVVLTSVRHREETPTSRPTTTAPFTPPFLSMLLLLRKQQSTICTVLPYSIINYAARSKTYCSFLSAA